jgi:hypothetical protein
MVIETVFIYEEGMSITRRDSKGDSCQHTSLQALFYVSQIPS